MNEPLNDNNAETGARLKAINALVAEKYPEGLSQDLIDRYRLKKYKAMVKEFAR